MRILIAPDKFRGTFRAREVCEHLARGMREAAGAAGPARIDCLPLADGGEGTLDIVMDALGGVRVRLTARGPLDDPVDAEYGVTPSGAAVIESARVCGLALVPPDRRDPLSASTRGLGETIAAALETGVRSLVVGLGGTATMDGGAGMASALGYRFGDGEGRPIAPEPADLVRVRRVDASLVHPGLARARVTALCDVLNPLLGPDGAARVFGPQKGASAEVVARLEAGLAALAEAVASWKGVDPSAISDRPGAGAAGGLGAGLAAFLGADLTAGARFVAGLVHLQDMVDRCDLVVTGEGSFDAQTAGGKVVAEVLAAAARAKKAAVVVAGRWDGSWPIPSPVRAAVVTPGRVTERAVFAAPGDLTAAGRWIFENAHVLACGSAPC